MRTENSIKNSIAGVFASFISILIGFITQKIFINILGNEYLGVNGLFTNIISMLSVAELGIGGTIIYHLYKPIAENDTERVKILLNFYKVAYRWISLSIFIVGLLLLPFIHLFIGETSLDLNYQIVYILFLLQTVLSYLLTYKRSILYAYQKNYIINIIHIFYLVIVNVVQIIFLLYTKNYYLYLIIKAVFVLLENIVINIFANKYYPFIKDNNVSKLDNATKKDVFKRVRAQFLHTVGGAIVNSTDNIIISKFLGVYTVGLHSNYNLIITSVRSLFSQLISSTTASVGDLLVKSDSNKLFDIYKKIRFANYWIAVFCGVCILVLMQDFIVIWIGKKYLLSYFVLITLVINLYQKLMRNYNDVFLIGAGICIENRFIPIIESIINIVTSILLVKIIGLPGVFIGTIISGFALWCYSYPKFVYKKLFKRSYIDYAKETGGYILLFFMICFITIIISNLVTMNNIFLCFVVRCIISIFIPNFLLLLLFRKTENFIYFKELIVKYFNKKIDKFAKKRG